MAHVQPYSTFAPRRGRPRSADGFLSRAPDIDEFLLTVLRWERVQGREGVSAKVLTWKTNQNVSRIERGASLSRLILSGQVELSLERNNPKQRKPSRVYYLTEGCRKTHSGLRYLPDISCAVADILERYYLENVKP